MASLEQRVARLEQSAFDVDQLSRAELIRASLLPEDVAASLDNDELRAAVRNWRHGEPFAVFDVPDNDIKRMTYRSAWFPTPSGWRPATRDELNEYQADLTKALRGKL